MGVGATGQADLCFHTIPLSSAPLFLIFRILEILPCSSNFLFLLSYSLHSLSYIHSRWGLSLYLLKCWTWKELQTWSVARFFFLPMKILWSREDKSLDQVHRTILWPTLHPRSSNYQPISLSTNLMPCGTGKIYKLTYDLSYKNNFNYDLLIFKTDLGISLPASHFYPPQG